MEDAVRVELDRIHDEDKRQNKRLDDLEKSMSDIRELVVTVKELAMSAKYTNEKLDKVEKDVEQIKHAPLNDIAEAKTTVMRTIVSVIVGALFTGFIWLITTKGGI